MIVATKPIIVITIPAVALPLFTILLFDLIPKTNPITLTGNPIIGNNHANSPIIPKTNDALSKIIPLFHKYMVNPTN